MKLARSQTLRIIATCLVSGAIAGLLTASQCRHAESDCHIAALEALSTDAVPWTLWLHWINWLPGAVFGLAYGLATLQVPPADSLRRLALYTLASAVIYVAAGLVFSVFLGIASGDEFSLIVWIWPGGLIAGLIGAALLAVAANLLSASERATGSPFSGVLLPAAVGALLGLAFVFICSYGEQQILFAWPAAFGLWQVAVGLALPPRHARTA